MDVNAEKIKLRQDLKCRMLTLTPQQRTEKSQKAFHNLINTPQFQDAQVIMIYLALPHEVDTAPIILHAWQENKVVAVPKMSWQQRHMIPVRIHSLETGLTHDEHNLQSPVAGVPVALEEIELVIAPGLGFDKNGNRLGRGGAHYDMFFANTRLTAARCGLAFEEQIVTSIPAARHDKLVDFLVTDEQVIYCNKNQRGKK
ncbi:MAG: 5-formyltetrahydrofolate cyclo-ligase [Planctomycetota bacterium]